MGILLDFYTLMIKAVHNGRVLIFSLHETDAS